MDWKIFAAAVLSWIQLKAKDKNAYVGIIAIAAALGWKMTPEQADFIIQGAALLGGFILLAWKTKPALEVVNVNIVSDETKASEEPKKEKQILKG